MLEQTLFPQVQMCKNKDWGQDFLPVALVLLLYVDVKLSPAESQDFFEICCFCKGA